MTDRHASDADADRLWSAEWWEQLADARHRWSRRHAGSSRALTATIRVALFVAVVVVIVTISVSPIVRAGLGAWLGAAWIAFLSFLLLRTKTLSWSTFWWVFTVSLAWSVLASIALGVLAGTVVSEGAEAPGPAVGIASFGEEALKLVPVLVLALLAPGRVHRFAVADWMLVGVASGAAFLAVEEFVRRVVSLGVEGGGVPSGFVSFGVLGMNLAYDGDYAYPGHHVATGLTCASLGLGIVLVRRGSRDVGARRAAWTAAGLLLPVVVGWLFVVRHAALNAFAVDAPLPTVMDLTERVLPSAWGRGLTVVVFLLVVQLVDVRRLARWRAASLEGDPLPAWLDGLLDTAEGWREAGPPMRFLAPVVESAGHLGHVVGRDVRQLVEVVASPSGENRWSAVGASRSLVAMQREMRQIVQHLDGGPSRPTVVRGVAVLAAVAVAVLTLVVAPHVATEVQAAAVRGSAWMAGLLEQFNAWWAGAGGWDKLTLTTGAVSAAALSTASLGSTASSVKDSTPLGAVTALGQGALGLGLRRAGIAGSGAQPLVAAAARYSADPVLWRSEQIARLTASGA